GELRLGHRPRAVRPRAGPRDRGRRQPQAGAAFRLGRGRGPGGRGDGRSVGALSLLVPRLCLGTHCERGSASRAPRLAEARRASPFYRQTRQSREDSGFPGRAWEPGGSRVGGERTKLMPKGYLFLVLHAHLPYIRHPEFDRFLEERWFFEAVTETYIPLIKFFDRLRSEGKRFKLTLSV